ncbi:hypothetical protein ASZ90_003256 [hydrocarbon metagenome]|uniref:Uncharacterized protein n=1 Tax=hydrocarbon metagenome TaxID=938273 RepID=A0A0W8G1Q7_9ZZZZ
MRADGDAGGVVVPAVSAGPVLIVIAPERLPGSCEVFSRVNV